MTKVYLKLVLKLLLLSVLVLSLGLQARGLNRGRAAIKDILKRYVPVSAVVFESEIKVTVHGRFRRNLTPSTRYSPIIRYHYIVDDQVHISTRYTGYDFFAYDRQDIQRILWQFQRGWRVTAYYDPKKPEESVLVLPVLENFSDEKIVYIVLSCVMAFLTGVWFLWSLRALKFFQSSPAL